jgi:hydrogenase maturation protease
MSRTLVMGYGNLDRGDDGVAFHVVNALRGRLGQKPLSEDETGLQELGFEPDSVFLRQLLPEWLETAAAYDRLIFIDAHVHEDAPDLFCVPVVPEFVSSPFTHHVTPAAFMAFVRTLYDRQPAGQILSIRGRDFDFCRGLSAEASRQVPPAVETILRVVELGDVTAKQETGTMVVSGSNRGGSPRV